MTNPVSAPGLNNPSLDQKVLHLKPLSPRIFHGAQHLHISFSKIQFEKGWQKISAKILSNSLLAASYVLAANAALIEGLASGVLGMTGALTQLLISRKSDLIEKYSIKTLAYSLNCLATTAISITSLIYFLNKNNDWALPKKHITASMLSGTAYLSAAALAQLFCTAMFNSIKGIKNDSPNVRSDQAIIEGTPWVFANIARSLHREFETVDDFNIKDARKYAEDYITAHPPVRRDWLGHFDLGTFINEHVISSVSSLIDQYMRQNHFVESDSIYARNENEIILARFTASEENYHSHLKTCVKEAVRLMYANRWARYMDIANDYETGLESIEYFMPECTIPLANIAQLIEIERSICCPKRFTQEQLKVHDSRREDLLELKPMLDDMSENDKELLIEHLIKTSHFELGPRSYDNMRTVDHLYNKICELAGNLHQGPLMTLPSINCETYEGSGHNYFGDCWRDGVQEFGD